jgi:hypothetical protein
VRITVSQKISIEESSMLSTATMVPLDSSTWCQESFCESSVWSPESYCEANSGLEPDRDADNSAAATPDSLRESCAEVATLPYQSEAPTLLDVPTAGFEAPSSESVCSPCVSSSKPRASEPVLECFHENQGADRVAFPHADAAAPSCKAKSSTLSRDSVDATSGPCCWRCLEDGVPSCAAVDRKTYINAAIDRWADGPDMPRYGNFTPKFQSETSAPLEVPMPCHQTESSVLHDQSGKWHNKGVSSMPPSPPVKGRKPSFTRFFTCIQDNSD